MDPFSIFLVAFLVMKAFKIAKVDREYAKRGQTPPGYQLAQQLLDRKKAAGTAPANATPKPYGARGYAKQRWQALWEDLGNKHKEQRANHKAAVVAAVAAGVAPPRKPTLEQRLATGWRWTLSPVGEPKKATPPPAGVPPVAGGSAEPKTLADVMGGGDQPSPATTPTEGHRTACPDCGQTLKQTEGGWEHPSSAGCPRKPASPDGAKPTQAGEPEPDATDKPNTELVTNHEGEPTMAQPSGEVTGLPSAIAYANAVADTHASHGSGEGFIASLTSFEVGPDDISKVQAAQESSRNAEQMWREAAQALQTSNNAVKEAYATSGGNAGNKQFNTQE